MRGVSQPEESLHHSLTHSFQVFLSTPVLYGFQFSGFQPDAGFPFSLVSLGGMVEPLVVVGPVPDEGTVDSLVLGPLLDRMHLNLPLLSAVL